MLIKLAWRNIYRNKRRTLLTISAVAFAVFFASFMNSFQKGAWDHMMISVVNSYSGFGQIHKKGYWDEQTLDNSFGYLPSSHEASKLSSVEGTVPRIESFALASYSKYTKASFVIGTDPIKEDQMTQISSRIVSGSYLSADDKAVIIGKGVAEALKININDTLVLIGQGYHGVNAAGKFLVKGILHFPSPELNKRTIFMPIKAADQFYGTEGNVTSLALDISNKEDALLALASLKTTLDTTQYEIMNWKEMLPELQQAREVDTGGAMIMLFVLYLIIGFVLLGTILMLTKERMHEFGILTAIGMNKGKLARTVWMEILLLGFVGSIVGIIISAIIVYYFHTNPLNLAIMGEDAVKTYESFGVEPIFPAAFEWSIFFNQAIIVAILTSVLSLYPIIKIFNLNTIAAMRD